MIEIDGNGRHDTLRADAQRNLASILAAAAVVFAEQGSEASVASVAERAGVGTATIFRRFPTKDDLLAAVVVQRFERLAEEARRVAETADPGEALRRVMTVSAEGYVGDRLIAEAVGTPLFLRPRIRQLSAEITAIKDRALANAQASGEVRPDVTLADISLLIAAVGFVGQRLGDAAPNAWRRCLDIVFDGLRPEVARPLSEETVTLAHLADLH